MSRGSLLETAEAEKGFYKHHVIKTSVTKHLPLRKLIAIKCINFSSQIDKQKQHQAKITH